MWCLQSREETLLHLAGNGELYLICFNVRRIDREQARYTHNYIVQHVCAYNGASRIYENVFHLSITAATRIV